MSERVDVYIDFDNVVISRYDDIHGKQAWRKDDPRKRGRSANSTDPIDVKLAAAKVDIGAIIDSAPRAEAGSDEGPAKKAVTKKAAAKTSVTAVPAAEAATDLLVRAIRVGLQKSDDDWVYAAGVKSQMQRMDPAFKEKSLGFTTFREFVESRSEQVVSKAGTNGQLAVRLA